jgi:predicted nucleic acid-binding protein
MRVYLDTCSQQRPLDDKKQIRVALEAEAISGVLALVETGQLDLVSSEVLQFETSQIPHPVRREHAQAISRLASTFIEMDDHIETRARQLVTQGIKPMDALHLASAEAASCDYFCTCDDRFLRRAQEVADLETKAVSPLDLVKELEEW